MLKPEVDRLDYGQQLIPPEGYELNVAIASTYSLDLNALLAVPIALCFSDTLDGDLKGEKLALFEAIGQLKDKLRVFYQKGNVANPSTFNRLFTLLEPCLQPVIPEGGVFSSFHPKFWLLRYVKTDHPRNVANVRYKLIVLSRNLTLDRSWDVAISLDGTVDTQTRIHKNVAWNRLVKSLLIQANGKNGDFKAGNKISDELERIVWTTPENFDDVSLDIGGKNYGRPVSMEPANNDVLMVVSPFIKSSGGDVAGLNWLKQFASTGEKYLFSRSEELDAVGEDKLSDWQCFAINEKIVKGEELYEVNDTLAGDITSSQNLHAKIIIHQKGKKAYWHLGSANATAAALGDDKNLPRNTEIMVSLVGASAKVGPAALKAQWVMEKSESSLFLKHEFKRSNLETNNSLQSALRNIEHQLICAEWILDCQSTTELNKFTLCLSVNPAEKLDNDVTIKVGQLAIMGNVGKRDFASKMFWENIDISQISALIPVEISITRNQISLEKCLLVEAVLNIEGGDNRHQFILKSLVDTPDKIMDYLRLLLQVNPSKDKWLSYGNADGSGLYGNSIFSSEPIFEQLLIASSQHPKLLERIANLIKELESSDVKVPSDFSELWKVFGKVTKK